MVLNDVSQGTLHATVGETGKKASLTLNDGVSIGKLDGIAGTTTVNGEVSIDNVNLGNGGNNDGDVLVTSGAVLTASHYWNHTGSDGAINVEKGGTLKVSGLTLTGTSDTESAKIKRTSNNGGEYALTSSDFTISDGQISVADGGTINNILSNVDVLHETNNTLTIDNASSDLNTVTVNKGTVNLASLKSDADVTATIAEAGTLALSGSVGALSATGEGMVVVNSGATLGGDSTISTDMQLNATLSVNGNLTVSSSAITLPFITDLETDDITYSDNGNGYVSGKFYLAKTTKEGSTATASDYTIDGYAVQGSGTNSLYIEADGTDGSYYVNTTVNYGGEGGSSQIVADTTTGITMNGGTLNLNTALASGVDIRTKNATNSVINVAGGVTLANSDVQVINGAKSTLKGEADAVYDMGSGVTSNGANVTFGTEWKGTTILTNATIGGSNLNTFGSENSTIKLIGVTGWMDFYNGTINRALILENYVDAENPANNRSAFIFNDNSQDKTYKFAKSVSGSGHFQGRFL